MVSPVSALSAFLPPFLPFLQMRKSGGKETGGKEISRKKRGGGSFFPAPGEGEWPKEEGKRKYSESLSGESAEGKTGGLLPYSAAFNGGGGSVLFSGGVLVPEKCMVERS